MFKLGVGGGRWSNEEKRAGLMAEVSLLLGPFSEILSLPTHTLHTYVYTYVLIYIYACTIEELAFVKIYCFFFENKPHKYILQ